jgi:hypothetical protein
MYLLGSSGGTMQRVASRIDAVTVYRTGALVSRVAELEVEGAELPRAVQIADLPLSLDDGSLRVRVEPVEGVDGSLPEAADVRVALGVPDHEGAPAPVEPESLRAARVEEERVREEIAQVERALERLAQVAMPARPPGRRGETPPPSPTAARIELLAFRSARTRVLHERRRALHEELRRAGERRAELEERERRASSARQAKEHELRKSAVVRLRPGTARAARLVLEYLVPGARWAPSYSIRFDRSLARAELSVRAVVCQRTGEDWHGVRLLLSTAQAQRWTELPELRSIRIGRVQPPPARTGWRPAPAGADALYADYDRAFGGPGRPVVSVPAPAPLPEPKPALAVPQPVRAAADRSGTAVFDEGHTTGQYEIPDFADYSSEFDDDRTSPGRVGVPDPVGMFREEKTEPARMMALPPAMPGAMQAAPAPMAPPLGAMQSVSSFAAPQAEGAEAYRRASPAKSRAVRSRAGGVAKKEAYGGGGGPGMAAPADDEAPATELRAAPELLAYGNLRMPQPMDLRRGGLVRVEDSEIYLALLAQLHVHVEFNVLAVLARAVDRARQIVRQPLPPRHVAPRDEDGFDYAYRAEAPLDIPADGAFHSVPLSQHQASARPRYVVVPRETRDVFRFVEIDSPLEAPLLPGPADVYIGEDFLVTTDVRATPPRGVLRLGLGVEQGIKVSRNSAFEEKTAGLMRGSLALRHEIRVAVANRLERPALVEVRERIPVPSVEDDSDIDVVMIDIRPAAQTYEQADAPIRGGRRWEVEVAPGKETEISAIYEVRIAGKHELVGGNRREA